MTNKTLWSIWAEVNRFPAWLEKLRKMGVCEQDLRYLEDLDENFHHGLKQSAWEAKLSKKVAREHFEKQEKPEYIQKYRRNYVNQRLQELRKELAEAYLSYGRLYKLDKSVQERSFLLWDIVEKEKEAKRLEMEKYCKESRNGITGDMIARARDYPLQDIVEVNARGFALCVWHDDKIPSMWCKGNRAWCFSCQRGGSSIDVAMKVYGICFADAVKRLQK